jgi:glycogen debranching enzyme
MGPFLKAYLAVHGPTAKVKKQAAHWLSNLSRFMKHEGVGQLPEIFDGNPPHRPGGCIAQAWTVAALLQACVEIMDRISAQKNMRKRAQSSASGDF